MLFFLQTRGWARLSEAGPPALPFRHSSEMASSADWKDSHVSLHLKSQMKIESIIVMEMERGKFSKLFVSSHDMWLYNLTMMSLQSSRGVPNVFISNIHRDLT